MLDALRGYLQLASGLTDVTKQRALAAARQLIDQSGEVLGDAVTSTVSGRVGGNVGRQVTSLAEDLLATSRTNRDLLLGIIRTEIDRAVAAMGLVSADDLEAMARKVERLERQLDAAVAFGGVDVAAETPPAKKAAKKEPARKVAAKKVTAKKVTAKKVATKKAAAKSPAKKVPVARVPAPPAQEPVPPTASLPAAGPVAEAAPEPAEGGAE